MGPAIAERADNGLYRMFCRLQPTIVPETEAGERENDRHHAGVIHLKACIASGRTSSAHHALRILTVTLRTLRHRDHCRDHNEQECDRQTRTNGLKAPPGPR